MKKQTGITLIALVITIIVLLILAGVSISMVVGNNGVLTQASTAVVKTKEATAREEVALAWSSVDSEYWTAWTDNSNVKKDDFFTVENLQKYLAGKGTVTSVDYATGTVVYEKDGEEYTFTIDANGNIVKSETETETGTGTEEEKTYNIGQEVQLLGTTAELTADNVDEATGYPIPNTLNYTTWNVIKQTDDTVTLLSQNIVNQYKETTDSNTYINGYDFVQDVSNSFTAVTWYGERSNISYLSIENYDISVPTRSDLEEIIDFEEYVENDNGYLNWSLKDESYAEWFLIHMTNWTPMAVDIEDSASSTSYDGLAQSDEENSGVLSYGTTPFIYKPVITIPKSEMPD